MGNNVSLDYKIYAQPSIIEGIGRLLDFSGSLPEYNFASSPKEADVKAISHDWIIVGSDLEAAINLYDEEKITE